MIELSFFIQKILLFESNDPFYSIYMFIDFQIEFQLSDKINFFLYKLKQICVEFISGLFEIGKDL